MSNFTCPTCGFTNIDCGKDGYKTAREIELEKKLEIAIKTLKEYANETRWSESTVKLGIDGFGIRSKIVCIPNSYFGENGYEEAQQALKEIKE